MNADVPYDAVLFDLLTALLDSWSLWNRVAGSTTAGLKWRRAYLGLTYACGTYRPYEELVHEAAREVGIETAAPEKLIAQWDRLEPWAEAPAILNGLATRGVLIGVVTNCSVVLGRRAVQRVGVPFKTIVTAEEAGFYKPHPAPYQAALAGIGTPPARTLFVAGSPADIPGAVGVGMPVFWHNRAGLPFLPEQARPLLIADTLEPLVELLR